MTAKKADDIYFDYRILDLFNKKFNFVICCRGTGKTRRGTCNIKKRKKILRSD